MGLCCFVLIKGGMRTVVIKKGKDVVSKKRHVEMFFTDVNKDSGVTMKMPKYHNLSVFVGVIFCGCVSEREGGKSVLGKRISAVRQRCETH